MAEYDCGLSPEETATAQRWHDQNLVVDLLFLGPLTPPVIPEDTTGQLRSEAEPIWDRPQEYAGYAAKQRVRTGEMAAFRDEWYGSGITAGNRQLDLSSPNEDIAKIIGGNGLRVFETVSG